MTELYPLAKEVVGIGSTATIEFDTGRVLSITIGHFNESNPSAGVISCEAPLAKTLLGKQTGETVTYAVNNQIYRAKILKIIN